MTVVESLGAMYGGVLGKIYGDSLVSWANGSSSVMQNFVVGTTRTGSFFGGKQVGVSFGNNTSFGGSVDPLLDPTTNQFWGRTNIQNYFSGDKK